MTDIHLSRLKRILVRDSKITQEETPITIERQAIGVASASRFKRESRP